MIPGEYFIPCRNLRTYPAKVFPNTNRTEGGVALILVLAFLVLISTLIIAFFTSVTTELSGSKSYANGATARQLADSTVQIAMGTVRKATAAADPVSGIPLAWASQPGMIRTYDNTGVGNPHAYYKLYSSDNSVVTSFPFDPATDVDAAWNSKPALFTDLNAPVTNGTTVRYPIVDPAAQGLVKGFSIDPAAPVSSTNKAPMPTKWLYVLNDGSLCAPVAGSSNTNVTVGAASTTNPIVGRIAFWTDDDTCKVNINTAAGDVWTENQPSPGAAGNPGSFWDVPRVFSTFDKTYLAQHQPAANEFQRYPGHPSTTYLSAVFPTLTAANLYQITPRVVQGGSSGGTAIATQGITILPNRLYASVDELLFGLAPTGTTPDTRTTNPTLTDAVLSPTRFFLTAHSRAPEINLFSQPRVVTWPISATNSATYRTPYDSLFAYCGTLNGKPYYFQRMDCDSPTTDLPIKEPPPGTTTFDVRRNRSLINYLRNLTSQAIPGFGTNTFLAKYPQDRDQILTEIFDYIRCLNAQDTSVAGLMPYATTSTEATGGTAKQGQIVPITDTTTTPPLRGFGRFPTVREASVVFVGVGQTAALPDPKTGVINKSIPPTNSPSQTPEPAIASGYTRVQAFFTLNFFDPSQGYAFSEPNFQVTVSGLGGFSWNNKSMGLGGTTGTTNTTLNYFYDSGAYGGYKGDSPFVSCGKVFNANNVDYLNVVGGNMVGGNTAGSVYIDLPTGSTFAFSGGTMNISIIGPAGGAALQTLAIYFPPTTVPVPKLAPRVPASGPTQVTVDYCNLTRYVGSWGTTIPASVGRFTGAYTNTGGSTSTKTWICGYDVIRSVEAQTDCRLIAAKPNVTVADNYFGVTAAYSDGATMLVHSMMEDVNGGGQRALPGAALSEFVPNTPYNLPSATAPDYLSYPTATDGVQPIASITNGGPYGYLGSIAFGVNGALCVPVNGVYAGTNKTALAGGTLTGYAPGDWDSGFGYTNDGAYINKADEGSINGLKTGNVPYFDSLASYQSSGGTFFSPNRQMPSPVMFGSLPTGVISNQPWQTLLFRPDPGGHPGAKSPPDYLLLDLFNMPVVEPYAMSDPFSTAGKINMNYQIAPFTYLTRSTGVQAVLRSEQLLTVPNGFGSYYKSQSQTPAQAPTMSQCRVGLDLDETLTGFSDRFAKNDLFRSASEVCSLWLVPQGKKYGEMSTFWSGFQLTGDNARERPYADIYSRLTTKSNTYTVHYRVQTLKSRVSSAPGQWTEGKDLVTAEFRGSSTFEQYLDTGDPAIPDYATATNPASIDNFYKSRVIETKQFTP